MGINLGSGAISKLYLGSNEIQKAYLGGSLVYDVGGGGAFDPDYQAVLDYATAQGYTLPSAGQQIIQNQLVLDLKSNSIWSALDIFYVPATDGDSDFATLNWKSPANFQLTKVNSPTFITNSGFIGNGTSAYLDTNFNLLSSGTNFVSNNNHIAAYSPINDTSWTQDLWSTGGFDLQFLFIAHVVGGTYQRHQSTAIVNVNNTNTNKFYHADRSVSTDMDLNINGVTTSGAAASVAIPNKTLIFLNGYGRYTTLGVSVMSAGASVQSHKSIYNTLVQNYMAAI